MKAAGLATSRHHVMSFIGSGSGWVFPISAVQREVSPNTVAQVHTGVWIQKQCSLCVGGGGLWHDNDVQMTPFIRPPVSSAWPKSPFCVIVRLYHEDVYKMPVLKPLTRNTEETQRITTLWFRIWKHHPDQKREGSGHKPQRVTYFEACPMDALELQLRCLKLIHCQNQCNVPGLVSNWCTPEEKAFLNKEA